jgi:hypothetical protein
MDKTYEKVNRLHILGRELKKKIQQTSDQLSDFILKSCGDYFTGSTIDIEDFDRKWIDNLDDIGYIFQKADTPSFLSDSEKKNLFGILLLECKCSYLLAFHICHNTKFWKMTDIGGVTFNGVLSSSDVPDDGVCSTIAVKLWLRKIPNCYMVLLVDKQNIIKYVATFEFYSFHAF